MKSSNDNQIRAVISAVFSFLLFLSVSCMFLCAGAAMTVFHTAHLQSSLEKSKYIGKSFQALDTILRQEAQEHDLPQDILAKKLDQKRFEKLLAANIQATYIGGTVDVKQEAGLWEKEIKKELDAYLKNHQVGKNQNVDSAVKELSKNAGNYYENYLTLPFGTFFAKYKSQMSGLIKMMIPIGFLLAAILTFILLRLQCLPYRGWYYVLSSVLAAALITIISGIALYVGADDLFPETLIGYGAFIQQFFEGAAPVFWSIGMGAVILVIAGVGILKRSERKK